MTSNSIYSQLVPETITTDIVKRCVQASINLPNVYCFVFDPSGYEIYDIILCLYTLVKPRHLGQGVGVVIHLMLHIDMTFSTHILNHENGGC